MSGLAGEYQQMFTQQNSVQGSMGLQVMDPDACLQEGAVCLLPPVSAGVGHGERTKVMKRAEQLGLPANQEYMRVPIARALVGDKPAKSKKSKLGAFNSFLRKL